MTCVEHRYLAVSRLTAAEAIGASSEHLDARVVGLAIAYASSPTVRMDRRGVSLAIAEE